ncbi:MAG: GHKL domain-containing protein [Roseburia sp.]|nr:GHKL domain-containing protein [Roseburia sp.]MCM1280002.1 GHKL domain-containing protein [Robinsoniella sp.]
MGLGMNVFYWVSNYILEFLKLNICVFGIFNCPGKGKKMQWVPSVVAIIFIGAFAIIWRGNKDIVLLITLLLIVNVFLALKRKKDIFLVILAFVMVTAVEVTLDGALRILCAPELLKEISEDTINFLLNTFSGLFLLILEGILHKKKNVFYFSAKNVTLVFMGLLGMMFYLYPIQYSYGALETDTEMLKISLMGVSVSSILFFVICFVNLKSINEREAYKERIRTYEEYVTKQELYYKELLQKDNETKQFRHDMLNHLACLIGYLEDGENERAMEYVQEMTGVARNFSKRVLTGNDTIDIVAADVFRQEKEVKLDWVGRFPKESVISDMDLCILFSNLLKNALEATRLYKGDEKEVTVLVRGLSSTYFIYVKNPCNQEPKTNESKFFTTKADKENHGFGMLNIEQVIKKYRGSISYDYKAPYFTASICLEHLVKKEC